jgi:excisionase family DNA binding protein
METPDDLMTIAEAAELLGVHRQTVYTAIREGRMESIKRYGKALVSRSEVDAYQRRTRPGGVKPRGRPRSTKKEL